MTAWTDGQQPVDGNADEGLSLSHISPLNASGFAAGECAGAGAWAARFWDGGTSVEVERLKPSASGAARVTDHRDKAAVARRKAQRRTAAAGTVEHTGGGKRGAIQTFSRASRLRLLQRIHRLRKDTKCLLVTLTLPDGVDTSGKRLKRWLQAWWKRIARRFPAASAMWRVESKARKSGAAVGLAVGHIHLLVFGVQLQPGLKQYISLSWFEVVNSGDVKHLRAGTRVEAPRDWDRVSKYAAKLYAAKPGDGDPIIPDVGRFWGFLAEALIPWAEAVVLVLNFREGFRLLRALRNWARADRRKRGLSPPGRLTQWRSFFVGDASQWLDASARWL